MFDPAEVSQVEGWLTGSEAALLYQLASRVTQDTVIVEIGSWKGKSTICLGKGSLVGDRPAVLAIDPHTGSEEHHQMIGPVNTFQEFKANIANHGLQSVVKPLVATSAAAVSSVQEKVGLLFIDGAHDPASVEQDFNLWFPKMVNGGRICFHDSWGWWGPNIVSAKILATNSQVRRPYLRDTITAFEKCDQATIGERVVNVLFVIWRSLTGIVGSLRLSLSSDRIGRPR